MTSSTLIPQETTGLASIPEAIAEIRAGRMVVVVDDADRENEGDLTLAAEKITPEAVTFMAAQGRGLICVAMTGERLQQLHIRLMTEHNTSNFGTAFCESVDARTGVSTGISSADRARTIKVLAGESSRPEDLARPGHVFPLQARPGGVLTRAGQTEAGVDLARMAGLSPAAVICEIVNDDGSMARMPELRAFSERHGLKMITVAELIRYRLQHERFVRRLGEQRVATAQGTWRVIGYRGVSDEQVHSAAILGEPDLNQPVLVRVQTHCYFASTLESRDCDCAASLRAARERIAAAGSGILVYLHQNTPGWSADAGRLEHGHTYIERQSERDRLIQRQIGLGAQILTDLGVRQLRLLTQHPRHYSGLAGFGLEVTEQLPLWEEENK